MRSARKVSKTSVLIEKERRDNLEVMNMADELKVDSARIKDGRY